MTNSLTRNAISFIAGFSALGTLPYGALAASVCVEEQRFTNFNGNNGFVITNQGITPLGGNAYLLNPGRIRIINSSDSGNNQAVGAPVTQVSQLLNLPANKILDTSTAPGSTFNTGSAAAGAVSTVSGGVTSVSASGSAGPPNLASVDITGLQSEDLVRQRRDLVVSSSGQSATSQPATNSPIAGKRPSSSVTSSGPVVGNGPAIATWGELFADYEVHKNLSPNSQDNPTRKQAVFGQIGGVDWVARSGSNVFQFGLLGGHTATRSSFSDTANVSGASVNGNGGFLGVYGNYQYGVFSADFLLKADFATERHTALVTRSQTTTTTGQTSTTPAPSCGAGFLLIVDNANDLNAQSQTVPASTSTSVAVTARSADVDSRTFSAGGNLYYRLGSLGGWFAEPLIGMKYTYVNYDGNAALVGIADGETLRVQAGLRVGTSWRSGGYVWSSSVMGLAYSDVMVRGFIADTSALPVGFSPVDEGKLRGLGQISLGVDLGQGLSLNARGDIRGGEDVWGVGGRIGARYQW